MDKYEVYIPAGEKAVGQLRVRRLIEGLDETKAWDVTVTKHRVKRSLTSNAYAWLLIGKIAERLHESKTSIYRSYIKEVGGNSDIVTVKKEAVEKLCKMWSTMGIGFITQEITNYGDNVEIELFYGSHTYDRAQMSRFIDLIVQDCKAINIPTKEPEELEALIKEWGIE